MKLKQTMSVAAILFLAHNLMADPAKKVEVTLSNDTLSVVATHKVKDSKKHYINQIDITVGDSLVSQNSYTEQSDNLKMEQQYILPKDLLIPGTTIYVETTCNKFGTKTGKATIPSEVK